MPAKEPSHDTKQNTHTRTHPRTHARTRIPTFKPQQTASTIARPCGGWPYSHQRPYSIFTTQHSYTLLFWDPAILYGLLLRVFVFKYRSKKYIRRAAFQNWFGSRRIIVNFTLHYDATAAVCVILRCIDTKQKQNKKGNKYLPRSYIYC